MLPSTSLACRFIFHFQPSIHRRRNATSCFWKQFSRNLFSDGQREAFIVKDNPMKLKADTRKYLNYSTVCGFGGRRLASTVASIEDKYSEEDLEKVLKIVNETNSPEDFKKFGISKKKVEELVKKKSEDGALKSIDDVISVVGSKSYSRFFCSILERPSQNVSNPIFPLPSSDLVAKVSTVLSLTITGGKVSWCFFRRMEDGLFKVESIVQRPFFYKPKMHFLMMLKEMIEIAEIVPETELCVVEEYPNTVPTPFMFTFQLHMAQLRSALLSNLMCRQEAPQVISIKSVAVARLFNTYIGSERVSGQHVVDNMITWKPVPSLIVPDVIKDAYASADSIGKEGMSSVFLLNLAYWTLTRQFVDNW